MAAPKAKPNELTISLGVQTQASTAAVALSTNSTKANALIAKLEADGVTEQDLQTSGLTVQPVYTGPKQLITSYQVMNTVTVTLYDLAEAGKIIDDAASAAGNAIVVNDIAFSVKDDTALLGQARAAAVRQAMGQAQLMASAAGMSLGHLCSLVDNSSEPAARDLRLRRTREGDGPQYPGPTGRGAGDGQRHRRLRARRRPSGDLESAPGTWTGTSQAVKGEAPGRSRPWRWSTLAVSGPSLGPAGGLGTFVRQCR